MPQSPMSTTEQHTEAPAEDVLHFLALGDSYTIGEGVGEDERWPVQLAHRLRAVGVGIADPTIIARTGWTTAELQSGIELQQPRGTFDLVTLQIGVNNQFRGLDESEFEKELDELLQRSITYAAGKSQSVIVLSIPDWGVTPFAGDGDREQIAAAIDRFNAVQRARAAFYGCRYIDVTPESRKADSDRSLLADDQLHPSAKMYQRWVVLMLPIVKQIFKPDEAG